MIVNNLSCAVAVLSAHFWLLLSTPHNPFTNIPAACWPLQLFNRNMEKVEAERMVHAIWQAKAEFQAQYRVHISLADYVAVWAQRK